MVSSSALANEFTFGMPAEEYMSLPKPEQELKACARLSNKWCGKSQLQLFSKSSRILLPTVEHLGVLDVL